MSRARDHVDEWRRPVSGVWHAWREGDVNCACERFRRTLDEDDQPDRSREDGWRSRKVPPGPREAICRECMLSIGYRRRKIRSVRKRTLGTAGALRKSADEAASFIEGIIAFGDELVTVARRVADEHMECSRSPECVPRKDLVLCPTCLERETLLDAINKFWSCVPEVERNIVRGSATVERPAEGVEEEEATSDESG